MPILEEIQILITTGPAQKNVQRLESDIGKLTTANTKAIDRVKKFEKRLKSSQRAFLRTAEAIRKTKDAQKQLSTNTKANSVALARNQKKLQELRDAQNRTMESMRKTNDTLKSARKEYKKVNTSVDKHRRSLRELDEGQNKINKSTKQGITHVLTITRAWAFATITVFAFANALTAIFREGVQFEKELSVIRALTLQTANGALPALISKIRELGATTEFTAVQIIKASKFLVMAGLNVKETGEALAGVIDLATVAQIDLSTAADITTNILAGFNLQIKDLARVNDIITTVTTNTNTTVEQLGEAMKFAAPAANALGFSIEKTAVALGILQNAGIKGSLAGTNLARALLNAHKVFIKFGPKGSTGDLIEALELLATKTTDAQITFDLFGKVGGKAAATFLKNTNLLKFLNSEVAKNAGLTKRLADEIRTSLSIELDKLSSAFSEIRLEVTNTNLKKMKSIVSNVSTVLVTFNKEFATTIDLLLKVVGFAVAGAIFTALAAGIGIVSVSLLAFPAAAFVGFVGGLVGLGEWIESNSSSVWNGLKKIGDAIGGFNDVLKNDSALINLNTLSEKEALLFQLTIKKIEASYTDLVKNVRNTSQELGVAFTIGAADQAIFRKQIKDAGTDVKKLDIIYLQFKNRLVQRIETKIRLDIDDINKANVAVIKMRENFGAMTDAHITQSKTITKNTQSLLSSLSGFNTTFFNTRKRLLIADLQLISDNDESELLSKQALHDKLIALERDRINKTLEIRQRLSRAGVSGSNEQLVQSLIQEAEAFTAETLSNADFSDIGTAFEASNKLFFTKLGESLKQSFPTILNPIIDFNKDLKKQLSNINESLIGETFDIKKLTGFLLVLDKFSKQVKKLKFDTAVTITAATSGLIGFGTSDKQIDNTLAQIDNVKTLIETEIFGMQVDKLSIPIIEELTEVQEILNEVQKEEIIILQELPDIIEEVQQLEATWYDDRIEKAEEFIEVLEKINEVSRFGGFTFGQPLPPSGTFVTPSLLGPDAPTISVPVTQREIDTNRGLPIIEFNKLTDSAIKLSEVFKTITAIANQDMSRGTGEISGIQEQLKTAIRLEASTHGTLTIAQAALDATVLRLKTNDVSFTEEAKAQEKAAEAWIDARKEVFRLSDIVTEFFINAPAENEKLINELTARAQDIPIQRKQFLTEQTFKNLDVIDIVPRLKNIGLSIDNFISELSSIESRAASNDAAIINKQSDIITTGIKLAALKELEFRLQKDLISKYEMLQSGFSGLQTSVTGRIQGRLTAALSPADMINVFNTLGTQIEDLDQTNLDFYDRSLELLTDQFDILGKIESNSANTITELQNTSKAITNTLTSLLLGDLNPDASFATQQAEFEKLKLAAITSGATQEAINKFATFVPTFLTTARDQFKSSQEFVNLFDIATQTLKDLNVDVLGDITSIQAQSISGSNIDEALIILSGNINQTAIKLDETLAQFIQQDLGGTDDETRSFRDESLQRGDTTNALLLLIAESLAGTTLDDRFKGLAEDVVTEFSNRGQLPSGES